jgi:Nif-specific regulatory protein
MQEALMNKKNDSINTGTEFEKKINKLKLVHYISVEMNKTHSTRKLLEIILERCLELTSAKTGSVMLIDDEASVLDIVAYKGIDEKVASKTRLKIGEGVTGWVAETGSPKLVNNTRQDPIYVKVKADLLSELAVPIKTEDKTIGVISVDSNRENAFTDDDLELLTMVAELAAQILLRDKIQEKLTLKISSQEILIETFNIIERGENLTGIFNEIMDVLKNRMGIARGMLVLFDKEDPQSLKIKSGYRLSEENIKKGIYRIGEGIIGSAVAKGQTIAVEDVEKDPAFLNKMKINRGAEKVSMIAAPIKSGNMALGVLVVEKNFETREHYEDSINTVTLLASLLAYRVRSYQKREEETKLLISENIELRKELKGQYSFKNIVGKNEQVRKILEQVKTVSNTTAPVLISGETGTGKEQIAKITHFLSDRRDNKFISVNCAAIPENLLESELFGYSKGAFTGASGDKKGKFELADNGTLFLDEIAEMPMHLQTKILRALQEKEIEPLGSEKTIKIDIRVIAATNRDLEQMISDNKFRADLYFRLNVINLKLPPLRERRDDIPLLVDSFIKRYNELYKKNIAGILKDVEDLFMEYGWPGNIRELENVMERAVIMAQSNMIDLSLVPDSMKKIKTFQPAGFDIKNYLMGEIKDKKDTGHVPAIIAEIEKIVLEEVLINTNNNKSRAAQIMGINRNTLKAKMRQYNIQ